MRKQRTSAATVLLALALAGANGCSGGEASAPAADKHRNPVPVTVARVQQRDIPVRIEAIGSVEPHSTVAVKAQVEGKLQKVHFTEGAEVRAGDLLFTIDPRPFEAALRRAEATLARNRAEANDATSEAKRMANLYERGFVSRDEHDTAQARAAALLAAVRADEAAVESAKLELEYCFIHAPIGGRIGQVLVHEGNVVKARETELAVINRTRPVHVSFAVPERELPRIRQHAAAAGELELVARTGANGPGASGTLSFINNAVDTNTGTILLKGEFPNQDEVLWPGQFVDVTLTLAVHEDAVLVPVQAVQTGQQGRFAFVVTAEHTAEMRALEVGARVGDELVIEDGLRAGELVVTDGHLRLLPGTAVEIKEAGPA